MPEAVQKMLRLRALVKAVVREEARVDAGSELVLRRREFDLWPLVQGLVEGG